MEIIFLPNLYDTFNGDPAIVDKDDFNNHHFENSLISMKKHLYSHKDLFTNDELKFISELLESEDKGNALWAFNIIKNKEIWI